MASGVTLQESEKNAPEGFFPKLYENVCKTMTENDLNLMPDEHDSNEKFIRYGILTLWKQNLWNFKQFSTTIESYHSDNYQCPFIILIEVHMWFRKFSDITQDMWILSGKESAWKQN